MTKGNYINIIYSFFYFTLFTEKIKQTLTCKMCIDDGKCRNVRVYFGMGSA